MRRAWRGRAVVVGLVLAAAGACSLPLPSGVQVPGKVTAEQRPQETLKVLPPGPHVGASPTAVVQGFLGAQSNADGGHAIARQFLSPALRPRWSDRGEVVVFDPATLLVVPVRQDQRSSTVRVTASVTGAINSDGSYAPRSGSLTDTYRLERDPRRQWRLATAPSGLRLSPADRDRSFRARRIYYVAPAPDPGSTAGAAHLVPDQVFLPYDADPGRTVRTLVRRLLQPPSRLLAGSVVSAVPPGAGLRSLALSPAGLVTVDLTAEAARLPGPARQALSAQLVWTLRQMGAAFTSMRLTVSGRLLAVPGGGPTQSASDWSSFDPEGLAPDPPVYYVAALRLHALGGELPSGPATSGRPGDGTAVAVDRVAVTPDRSRLALLAQQPSGTTTVRVGLLSAASYPVVLSAPALRSPTWGSGERGLWLLRGGREVLLVPATGPPQVVPTGRALPGPVTALAVSRDGARVALVARGALYVGRVTGQGGAVRLAGLSPVAPEVSGVTALAFESGTSLVLLGRLRQTFLALRVAVDGSDTQPFDGPGLPGPPIAVAASPQGVVVTATAPGDKGPRLYRANARGFTPGPPGTAPAYPG